MDHGTLEFMGNLHAAAVANPNIAFIKYWGDRDHRIHLPVNGSISMVMDGLETHTSVSFDPTLRDDSLTLNGISTSGNSLLRVQRFLQYVRDLVGEQIFARVESANNFPMGAGIASSASAFAALSLAATRALGMELSEMDLSRLARLGSGSACRSIPGGFSEWIAGSNDSTSFAQSIAPPDHWDLVDVVVIISREHKKVGSIEGHRLASTSPFQNTRVAGANHRLDVCRSALLLKDFDMFADIVEFDSNLMHAVMMTSNPPLFFWEPDSLQLIKEVPHWRKSGLPVCYTLDAGPNVHLITLSEYTDEIKQKISGITNAHNFLTATPGKGARACDSLINC